MQASHDPEELSWIDATLSSELPRLAGASETQFVEFKREFPKQATELAKEIAAFATSNAGIILLGVEDTGEIVGLPDCSKDAGRRDLRTRLEGLFNLVRPTIAPSLRFAVFDDKVVAAIDVPKGSQPVYYSNYTPYNRVLTSARPMGPDDVVSAVLAWSREEGEEPSAEAQFLGELAGLWPQIDLTVSERRLPQMTPWSDTLRWSAGAQAEAVRHLAASAPHELEKLREPLRELAGALEVIATERRLIGGSNLETLGAIEDAARIIEEVRASYLGPGRFSQAVVRSQQARLVTESRLLSELVERIDAAQGQMSSETIQSEVINRGEALFHAASLGAGVGSPASRDQLRQIAETLRGIGRMRVYMDGGKSIERLAGATKACNEQLQTWLKVVEG